MPDRSWAAAGETTFLQNCAPCHGPTGAGDGPVMVEQNLSAPGLSDPEQVALGSPADWFRTTRDGRIENLMPPWGNQLTDAQIGDVVAWIWQLSTSPDELDEGARLWATVATPLGDPDWRTLALTTNHQAWAEAVTASLGEQQHPVPTTGELRLIQRYLQSLALTPDWASPLRPGAGVLKGRIRQLSPEEPTTPPTAVRLQAQVGETILDTYSASVAADGTFVLEGVEPAPRILWTAQAEQANLDFESPPVRFDELGRTPELTLDLYLPSATQGQLEVESLQLVLALSGEQLLVGQTVLLVNTLPWVFTGEAETPEALPVTARIPIDPAADEVTLADFGRARFTAGDGFVLDSAPIYPVSGRHQAVLGYSLPWPLADQRWRQAWPYPVRQAILLIADVPGLEPQPAGFVQSGERELDGQGFTVWQAANLADGILDIRFSGPAAARTGAAGQQATAAQVLPEPAYLMPRWLPAALALILLAGGGLLLLAGLLRGRREGRA
ncbi:MAG: cytochrome c [Caldilineaceae bacterium]|nr:cytochrome c [Caldilineaceae bacterium]